MEDEKRPEPNPIPSLSIHSFSLGRRLFEAVQTTRARARQSSAVARTELSSSIEVYELACFHWCVLTFESSCSVQYAVSLGVLTVTCHKVHFTATDAEAATTPQCIVKKPLPCKVYEYGTLSTVPIGSKQTLF